MWSECNYCGNPCKPHYQHGLEKFCSKECAHEWVRERTRVEFAEARSVRHCDWCGDKIPGTEMVYFLLDIPYVAFGDALKSAYGKKFCCPDCAHDFVDLIMEESLQVITKNVLPINAYELIVLLGSQNISTLRKLAMFEGNRIDWYEQKPDRFLTAPTKPIHAGDMWSPTLEYVDMFKKYLLSLEG